MSDRIEATLTLEGTRSMKRFYIRYGKRVLDLIVSVPALIVLGPVLCLIAVTIRLTSSGRAIYRQRRVGRNGRLFWMWKYRTMHDGSDRSGAEVVVPGDQRVTPIGKFLRRTKLDELPQLVNVLLGDMSLVGPRPLIQSQVDLEDRVRQGLLAMRPGLTSYASIRHRLEADYCAGTAEPHVTYTEIIAPQKAFLDAEYVRDVSFQLDVRLIILTLFLVLFPVEIAWWRRPLGAKHSLDVRVPQIALDLLLFAAALEIAYLLRFEGQIPEFNRYQMDAFLLLLPAMRIAVNRLFGVYDMIWSFMGLADAIIYTLSLAVVSAILAVFRFSLSGDVTSQHVFQIPLSVIALEFFLALGSALALRALWRMLYVLNHRYQPFSAPGRRIMIFGAGLLGAAMASQLGHQPHLEMVGFLDDDLMKQNRRVAGYRVLGTSKGLTDLLRLNRVSDLIVCTHSASNETLTRIRITCQALGIKMHIVPSVDELLWPKDGNTRTITTVTSTS